MESEAIKAVVEMMEGLPDTLQHEMVRYLRDYLEDLRDEQSWDEKFKKSRDSLARRAKCASEQIESGMVTPLDHDLL
ncbi:MAG: hypothetical protein ACP5M0_15685 [Desulfomonilaceae bacterium]